MDPDDSSNSPAFGPDDGNGFPDPNRAPRPPPSIPDHELIRCIGRGSFGTVWLARSSMGVYRAVKVVYRQSFKDQRPFDRERSGLSKFEPISRLHPGFAQILHVGINEPHGYFYQIMELADDEKTGQSVTPETYQPRTLTRAIRARGTLPAGDCIHLGLSLSDALAELHRHNLVHRDIKPSNIIFVRGMPKLADIGLVTDSGEAQSYVGTEGFIAPEGPGTPKADIFSLGKVLYEASTGNDRQEFPELPTRWDQAEDHEILLELNEVIVRACRPDPAKRYASARDMHSDLLLLTNKGSVKKVRDLERKLSMAKRIAAVAAAVLIIGGGIGLLIQHERRITQEAHQRDVGANVAYGNNFSVAGDFTRGLRSFAEALRLDQDDNTKEQLHRLRVGAVLAECPRLTHWWNLGHQVNSCEISPDGTAALLGRAGGPAEIRSMVNENAPVRQFGSDVKLTRTSYSPDGRFIVGTTEKGSIYVWDTRDLQEVSQLEHTSGAHNARFSPDGTRIAVACDDGMCLVWDWKNSTLPLKLPHDAEVRFATFNRAGDMIATTCEDGSTRLWDAKDGRCISSNLLSESAVSYASFSPDGDKLVTASESDSFARVWDLKAKKNIRPDLQHEGNVWSAEFSPDGRWILTSDLGGTVRFWSAETLKPAAHNAVLWHGARVTHATFSRDGHQVITACVDGSVRVWDMAAIANESQLVEREFSFDGNYYVSISNNCWQAFQTLSQTPVSTPYPLGEDVANCRLSSRGDFFLIERSPGTDEDTGEMLEIRDVKSGDLVGPAIELPVALGNVCLAKTGRRLLMFRRNEVSTWDVTTGKLLATREHEMRINSVAFDDAGKLVISWAGPFIHVWDAVSGKDLFKPLQRPFAIRHCEFSPDGSLFVSSGYTGGFEACTAEIWRTSTGERAAPPLAHTDGVNWANFSRDGRRVVTAGKDSVSAVWDVATGRKLRAVKHPKPVEFAVFSDDGQWIIDKPTDNTISIWNAQTGDPVIPPLVLEMPGRPALLADGRTVAIISTQRSVARLWKIPRDDRPPADVVRLGRLLTGDVTDSQEAADSVPRESLESIYKDLRKKYPASFAVSTNEIVNWYRMQAIQSAAETNWLAEEFHLKRLQALRPNDPEVAQALKKVQTHFQITDPSTKAAQ